MEGTRSKSSSELAQGPNLRSTENSKPEIVQSEIQIKKLPENELAMGNPLLKNKKDAKSKFLELPDTKEDIKKDKDGANKEDKKEYRPETVDEEEQILEDAGITPPKDNAQLEDSIPDTDERLSNEGKTLQEL